MMCAIQTPYHSSSVCPAVRVEKWLDCRHWQLAASGEGHLLPFVTNRDVQIKRLQTAMWGAGFQGSGIVILYTSACYYHHRGHFICHVGSWKGKE